MKLVFAHTRILYYVHIFDPNIKLAEVILMKKYIRRGGIDSRILVQTGSDKRVRMLYAVYTVQNSSKTRNNFPKFKIIQTMDDLIQ